MSSINGDNYSAIEALRKALQEFKIKEKPVNTEEEDVLIKKAE